MVCCALSSHSQEIKKFIEKGNADKLEKYLSKGGNVNELITYSNSRGDTYQIHPLLFAVGEECISCVEVILNQPNLENKTEIISEAFAFSLSSKNNELPKLLFAANPDLNGKCNICHGNNALFVATTYGKEEWYFKLKPLSDTLYINNSGANLAHAAAVGPNPNIAKDVVTINGINLNHKDSESMTPLDYAVSNESNPAFVHVLIDHGAVKDSSWNLLYWWGYFPSSPNYTSEFVEPLRHQLWQYDENDYFALTNAIFLIYDYEEVYPSLNTIKRMLEMMVEDVQNGHKIDPQPWYYAAENYLTADLIWALENANDYQHGEDIYINYLTLAGQLYKSHQIMLIDPKSYKKSFKLFGKDKVIQWHEEIVGYVF